MKTLFIILLLLSSSAYSFDGWSEKDVQREQEYLVYHVLDWAQTLNIATHPATLHEETKALGLHPSKLEVDRFFLSLAIAHFVVSNALPSELRVPFQNISIIIKKGYVDHNISVGISAGF